MSNKIQKHILASDCIVHLIEKDEAVRRDYCYKHCELKCTRGRYSKISDVLRQARVGVSCKEQFENNLKGLLSQGVRA